MKKTPASHWRARAGNKVTKGIVRQVLSAHPERYMRRYLRQFVPGLVTLKSAVQKMTVAGGVRLMHGPACPTGRRIRLVRRVRREAHEDWARRLVAKASSARART